MRIHADELDLDTELARRLLSSQFPAMAPPASNRARPLRSYHEDALQVWRSRHKLDALGIPARR